MADPISATSGVVALIAFGTKGAKSLYRLIESFDNHTKIVRDLKTDLKALDGVLEELNEIADSNIAARASSLKLPLHSCGLICREFDALVTKCAGQTTEHRRSIRDWSKLQLKSDDINAFRTTLSAYKSTIHLALGGIQIRTAQVTMDVVREYKSLAKDTKADLKEQLDRIEDRLANGSSTATPPSAYLQWSTSSQHRVEQEKNSIMKCLDICDEVSAILEHRRSTISEASSQPSASSSSSSDVRHDSVVTAHASVLPSNRSSTSRLNEAQKKIDSARSEFEARFSSIDGSESSNEPHVFRQCLAYCDEALREANQARVCSYEDVSSDESGRQYIVSTIGDLICAKRVTTGPRSVTIMGQMSDESLQQSFLSFGSTLNVSGAESAGSARSSQTPAFQNYGMGHRLSSGVKSE